MDLVPEVFQFTHPGRGATDKERILNRLQRVSIHAPREGCDSSGHDLGNINLSFNSRTPGGVRLSVADSLGRNSIGFNSRTPGGVRHLASDVLPFMRDVSIHAPREGCDRRLWTAGGCR